MRMGLPRWNECELMRLLSIHVSGLGFVNSFLLSSKIFFTFLKRFVLYAHHSGLIAQFYVDVTNERILNSIFIEYRCCAANVAPNDLHNFRTGPPFRYLYARVISCYIFAMRWLVIKITLCARNTGKRRDCLVNRPYART